MKCPNCNNEVSEEWAICPFCKYEPVKCPQCNSGWLPQDAKFCPSCGTKLDKKGVDSSFEKKQGVSSIITALSNYKNNVNSNNPPYIRINKVWVEYNAYENGQSGMLIHVHFDAKWTYKHKIQVVAYFYDKDTGQPIKDKNDEYCTINGNVCVYEDITPNANNCKYKDLKLFMPYKELHITCQRNDYGFYIGNDCFFNIGIWDGKTMISESESYYFEYNGTGAYDRFY